MKGGALYIKESDVTETAANIDEELYNEKNEEDFSFDVGCDLLADAWWPFNCIGG